MSKQRHKYNDIFWNVQSNLYYPKITTVDK